MSCDWFKLTLKFLYFNGNNDPNHDPKDPNRDVTLMLLLLMFYCGAGMFDDNDENSSVPSSEHIPVELMTPFLDKSLVLFTDNYYTSPALASLLSRKTYLNGIIRMNRKLYSKGIVNEQLERDTTVVSKIANDINNKMVACKYRANQDKSGNKQKVAYILSSYYIRVMTDTGKTDKSGNSIIKPRIIKHYCNTHMGDIDRVGQQLHGIQVLRKTCKWYKKKLVFCHIMQCSLNAQ